MPRLYYLVLLPLLAVLGFVEVYPLANTLYLSLITYGSSPVNFVGASNYLKVLGDRNFWDAATVSFLYAGGSTFVAFVTGLAFAYLVTEAKKNRTALETIFMLPIAVSPIAVGVLWSPSGFWDDVQTFGHFILKLPFFNELSPTFYFPVMVVSESWEWAPLMMLVFLSVISSIPKSVEEAATLHGATSWQKFRRITIPILLKSPVTQFIIIIRFVDAMKAFEIPYAWAAWVGTSSIGNPTDTLSLYLYKLLTFPIYQLPISYMSTVATLLFVITAVSAALLLRLVGRAGLT